MRNFSATQREREKFESLSNINIKVNKNHLLLKATRLKIATVITLRRNCCFEFFDGKAINAFCSFSIVNPFYVETCRRAITFEVELSNIITVC